jgi:hypothetical protein
MTSNQIRARLVIMAVVLLLAWFFAGITGVIAGTAGVILAAVKTPRWVAAGALAALVVAAAATIVQARPTTFYNPAFATRRPVASEAARIAGILTLVAVVASSVDERSRHSVQVPGQDPSSGPTPS